MQSLLSRREEIISAKIRSIVTFGFTIDEGKFKVGRDFVGSEFVIIPMRNSSHRQRLQYSLNRAFTTLQFLGQRSRIPPPWTTDQSESSQDPSQPLALPGSAFSICPWFFGLRLFLSHVECFPFSSSKDGRTVTLGDAYCGSL
jgi:hypothetical protein